MNIRLKHKLQDIGQSLLAIIFSLMFVSLVFAAAYTWEDDANGTDLVTPVILKANDTTNVELPEEYMASETGDKLKVIKKMDRGITTLELVFDNPQNQ